MPFRSDASTGISLVMIAAALWATVGVAVQVTPEAAAIPDTILAATRTGIAGPILVALWAITGKDRLVNLRALAPQPLVIFALASAVFQICLFRCFAQLGVTVAVFLTVCLPPVLAWAWSALTGIGGLSRRSSLALALAIAGMALVSFTHRDADSASISLAGLVNGLIAAIAFVAMSIAAAEMSRRSRPILVAGAGLTLSAVLLIMMALISGEGRLASHLADVSTLRLGLLVAYLGLLPTALAYLCYCSGMAKCRTPVVGLVASMIEPLLAALLAALFLGERISPSTAGGCALLMGAMVLLWQSERTPPALPQLDRRRAKDHPGLRGSASLWGAARTE